MKHYHIRIPLEEAMRHLDYADSFPDQVKAVVDEVNRQLSPRVACHVYEPVELSAAGLTVGQVTFNPGERILKAFEGSEAVCAILATVGQGVSDLSQAYSKGGDLLESFWCDKLANRALDLLLQQVIAQLRADYAARQWQSTSQWGPGYCQWPITDLCDLIRLATASCSEVSVTQTASGLLCPVKSMACLIGLGRQVKYHKSNCADCTLEICAYKSIKW